MEVTTIGFGNYPFAAVSPRAIVKPVIGPSELKAALYSGEAHKTSVLNSAMFRLTSVTLEPPQSHPVDRLLPQSRLQRMKKLLQLAAAAGPGKTKSPA